MKFNRLVLLTASSIVLSTFGIAAYANQYVNKTNSNSAIILVQSNAQNVASGAFVGAEKPTAGTAVIVKEGESYYLELSDDFSTSDQGPDLQVLLDTNQKPPQSYQNANSYINLGKLQNFNGKQRYEIPSGTNPTTYKSVVIWCRMANATFGYAPLSFAK